MTYYIKNGNKFTVTDQVNIDIHDQLPVGNYIIKEDQHHELFLEQVDAFEHSGKIYGDTTRNVERILRTFDSRDNSTGVMLTGEKGSGKTLLAKMLSITAAEQSLIPTIIINAPWTGDRFNKFVQSIKQPCIVLFDEFEKVYDRNKQEGILTLLDGVFQGKKLFILTCNDKWRIDSNMQNRPGRIYYMMDFSGLSAEFIMEYCSENLKNQTHSDTICKIASLFSKFNFDMLKALVEEMNRYDENPQQALKMLNVRAEFSEQCEYTVDLTIPGEKIKKDSCNQTWRGNPLGDDCISMDYRVESEDDDDWNEIEFEASDLRKVDATAGTFTFVNDDGHVTLTRVKKKQSDYFGAF